MWANPLTQGYVSFPSPSRFSPEQWIPQTLRTCVGMLHCDSSIWTHHTDLLMITAQDSLLKDPGLLRWTLTSVDSGCSFNQDFVSSNTQLYHLHLRGMLNLHEFFFLVFDLRLCEMYTTGIFVPWPVCVCVCVRVVAVQFDWDMRQWHWLRRPIRWVSLGSWAPLIILGWLAVPGLCEQRRSLLGSIIYDCQSDDRFLHLCYWAHYSECQ